jgi:hypothetical protein
MVAVRKTLPQFDILALDRSPVSYPLRGVRKTHVCRTQSTALLPWVGSFSLRFIVDNASEAVARALKGFEFG